MAQRFSSIALELPMRAHALGKIPGRMRLAAALERKVRSLSPDIVHDMGSGWYCDVFESHDGVRFAQWNRKLLALPRSLRTVKRLMFKLLPRYREFARLEKRQLATRDRIVLALSKSIARDYGTYYRLPPEEIRLIYNGIDTKRFSPNARRQYRDRIRERLRISPSEMLVLFVGNDFLRKGLPTAIRAIRNSANTHAPIRLAVAGAQRPNSSTTHPQGDASDANVTFVGRVPDPLPYYAAADVCVLPTLYDPCSLTILEAMATGLPCVTTVFNGVAELMKDGVEGYVLSDPTDHQLLATRLRSLLDPNLRLRMGKAARQLALRHTIEHNCDEILELYSQILDQRFRPTIDLTSERLRRELCREHATQASPSHSTRKAA